MHVSILVSDKSRYHKIFKSPIEFVMMPHIYIYMQDETLELFGVTAIQHMRNNTM